MTDVVAAATHPIPHATPFDWSSVSPPPAAGRWSGTIRTAFVPGECRVALLGLADDTGVGMNGGRVGARDGPAAFRRALVRYGTTFDGLGDADLARVGVFDAGDVRPLPGDDLHATHDRATEALARIVELGLLPVCVGGGHDLTFAGVRAIYRHVARGCGHGGRGDGTARVAGLNIDPHLDVRETAGSGMPFRRILEDGEGIVDPFRFSEIGLGPFVNAPAHLSWARERGCELVFFDGNEARLLERFDATLDRLAAERHVFASFDLDSLDGSVAPGVSAVNAMGLSAATAARMCRAIGRLPGLRYFDLMELCPAHDDAGGRTARVAAHLFLSFLAGVAERGR